jgi:hypothetical protein
MADIDRLLRLTRKIETALRRRGAQGRGMHGMVSSIEADLPADLVKQLRWLATLRNKAVHEDGFRLQDVAAIERTAAQALRRLGAPGLGSLFYLPLAPRTTRVVWMVGTALTGAACWARAPAAVMPAMAAGLGAGLGAWALHPVRQPHTLALLIAGTVLATLMHWLA